MKLSNRKQLLSEADAELKRMRRLNESPVAQEEVEKAIDWLRTANNTVHNIGGKEHQRMDDFIEDFFRYLEIAQGANPRDAKQFKKNAEFAVNIMDVLIYKVKENLSILKKLEPELPKIQKIVKSVGDDLNKMK